MRQCYSCDGVAEEDVVFYSFTVNPLFAYLESLKIVDMEVS